MRADEANQKDLEMQELFEAEIKSKLIEDCNDAVEAAQWWAVIDNDKTYIAENDNG